MSNLPERAGELWVYLAASPLFWLTAVLAAYLVAERIAKLCHRHPLANTVAIATAILATLLLATHTPTEPSSTAPNSCTFCSARRPSRWRSRCTAIFTICGRRCCR